MTVVAFVVYDSDSDTYQVWDDGDNECVSRGHDTLSAAWQWAEDEGYTPSLARA